jgi:hypothetical protein
MIHYASDRGSFAGGILWIEMEQAKEPNLIEKFVEKVRERVKNDQKPLKQLSRKDHFTFLEKHVKENNFLLVLDHVEDVLDTEKERKRFQEEIE